MKHKIYRDLEENFYTNIPFPLSDQDIKEVILAFFKFLEQPDEVKNYIN